jgi:hypothetical protein
MHYDVHVESLYVHNRQVLLIGDNSCQGILALTGYLSLCTVITVIMVMLLRNFGPYWISIGVYCYNRFYGNAVKEFWALLDIYRCALL